jgi:hypothetical protein
VGRAWGILQNEHERDHGQARNSHDPDDIDKRKYGHVSWIDGRQIFHQANLMALHEPSLQRGDQ